MKPTTVIEALLNGTATQEQRDWARRRCQVLAENEKVFGQLEAAEEEEHMALIRALCGGSPF